MRKAMLRWFLVAVVFWLIGGTVPLVFNHVGVWFAFGYAVLLVTLTMFFSKTIGKFLGVNDGEK